MNAKLILTVAGLERTSRSPKNKIEEMLSAIELTDGIYFKTISTTDKTEEIKKITERIESAAKTFLRLKKTPKYNPNDLLHMLLMGWIEIKYKPVWEATPISNSLSLKINNPNDEYSSFINLHVIDINKDQILKTINFVDSSEGQVGYTDDDISIGYLTYSQYVQFTEDNFLKNKLDEFDPDKAIVLIIVPDSTTLIRVGDTIMRGKNYYPEEE